MKLLSLTAAVIAATLSVVSITRADVIAVSLGGSTQFDGWTGSSLTASANPGYPGFPGSGAWPTPIGSSDGGSGDAVLSKLANGAGGGPYPASGSIYYGGFSGDVNNDGGRLAVSDGTPVTGLANVVFQIEIGEAWTYDFFDGVLPELSYTTAGGTFTATPAQSGIVERVWNGTVTMPSGEEDVYINTYLIQWDLSAAAGSILGFDVAWNGVQHGQVYELRLDQSDAYALLDVDYVPEPASLGLLAMGALLAVRRRSR